MGTRLVRDRALDSWAIPGAEHQVRPVRDAKEHQELLVAKVMEEATEVILAKTKDDLTKELADLIAVLEGCAAANGIDWEEVLHKVDERELQSGGFIQGMVWETPR